MGDDDADTIRIPNRRKKLHVLDGIATPHDLEICASDAAAVHGMSNARFSGKPLA